jgi:hypothetical protein
MTETVLNRSPLASAKPAHMNRRRVRAAECMSRRLSSTAGGYEFKVAASAWAPHQSRGRLHLDLLRDGRE